MDNRFVRTMGRILKLVDFSFILAKNRQENRTSESNNHSPFQGHQQGDILKNLS